MTNATRLPGTPAPTVYWQGADGVRIAGDAWGHPNAPLVLLQHGGGQTRHAWKGAGEALAAVGYHAVAFDARGHGDSGWPSDGDYGLDGMVADLTRVVDAYGAAQTDKRPVLVGASMGGVTSLAAIGENAVDAAALVLVDIAPQIEPTGAERILDFMRQKPEGFTSLDEVADAIAAFQPHRTRPRSLDGLAKNLRIGENGRYFWHWDPRFLASTRDHKDRTDRLKACAQQLTLPTLLVRGGLSDVLSESGARAFLDMCPHAEYVSVTDAAHMVAGDRNDIFSQAVVDFLTRTAPIE